MIKIFSLRKQNEPGILLVTGLYLKSGGVEKQIEQYSAVWEERGYRVYIAASSREKNSHKEDLFLYPNQIFLNNLLLKCFIRSQNIKIVEYEVGGEPPALFNFNKLKKRGVCFGVVLHAASASWDYSFLSCADYVFCISPVMAQRVSFLDRFPVLPNALPALSAEWCFAAQNKALFVSRLSVEKIPSIESFITFCLSHNFVFEIAGDILGTGAREVKTLLQSKYGLEDSCFIGEIKTLPYLKDHVNDFLFVGGVGQVILEGGALGYPCMVCSLCGLEHSFFVTKENFQKAYNTNFSPHSVQESIPFRSEANSLVEDFEELCVGKIDKFMISSEIMEHCNITKPLALYEKIVFSKMKELYKSSKH